ncbi:MAG: esterase [Rikenellaceae bacterium]|jgi:enterochelin esterase family protein|nr:esterase [Rikenellaceae bacterium]
MKKLILVCGVLLLALCAQAQFSMQLPSELTPLPSNINKNGYPAVTEDGRVVFRLRAPGAEKVQLDLGRLYDMTREENGFWTVTTDPQELGFHYYSLVLEGISVADPASESYYGMGRMASGIDIPEPGVDFYTLQDVPHGTIRSEWYYSEVTGSWRHMNVYTPPGYDTATDTRYPVMYLWHGGGEDERGWAVQGRTDIILDNLIAAGQAVPMIVVIGNGNASTGGYTDDAMETFRRELVESIIPYVEGRYRAYTDAKHRAISGLSMGGGQAYYTGLRNPELFSAIGVYSSGLFGRSADAPAYDAESEIPGLLTAPERWNEALDVFYISCGQTDPRIEPTKKAVERFREAGLEVQFNSFPGGHEWLPWRKSLHDFAQRIFK